MAGSLDTGRADPGTVLQWSEVERIIRLVASHIRLECMNARPLSRRTAGTAAFEGLIPSGIGPVFLDPQARCWHRLDDYVDQSMPPQVASWLKEAVLAKGNIVVVGGTSSGKTTLVNALLAEVATTNDRVVILEDTRELNCAAEDCVKLRTKHGVVSLADLVRSTLRLRPDRIIVGEVRGANPRYAEGTELAIQDLPRCMPIGGVPLPHRAIGRKPLSRCRAA
jgi:type IV secretion system protein VirB11